MEKAAWNRIEFVVNVESGACHAYLEYDGAHRELSTTFTKYLKDELKLFSIDLNTFGNDGQAGAASAILFIRDASKEHHCLHGWRGKLEAVLARRLSAPAQSAAAGGSGGSGGADYMSSAEELSKLQATIELSKLETTRIQETTTGISQQTAGISQHMARKTDTDALNARLATMQTTLEGRNRDIRELQSKNESQARRLCDFRLLQTAHGKLEVVSANFRKQFEDASKALGEERKERERVRKELLASKDNALKAEREWEATRASMETKISAHELERNEWNDARTNMENELRDLKRERANWLDERERLLAISDNNVDVIMDAVETCLRGERKRARTQHRDAETDTQPFDEDDTV